MDLLTEQSESWKKKQKYGIFHISKKKKKDSKRNITALYDVDLV